MKKVLLITTVLWCLIAIPAVAVERAPRITDREIIESLSNIRGDIKRLEGKVHHLEDGQKAILKEMDRRFESMGGSVNERFNGMEKRFESMENSMNKRFESMENSMNGRFESMENSVNGRFESMENSMNKRFDSMENQIQNLVSVFIGIVAAFAGIVAITIGFAIWDRRTALRPTLKEISEVKEKENKIVKALEHFAKQEPKMAEVLRSVGLL